MQLDALLQNFLALALESAPWLVLGLVLGGLIKVLFPIKILNRHLRQDSVGAISKATLLGAPLPLCSCGVVPAAVGLREAGASKPATVSFLISTPETGVDSVSMTYALMGPIMAIARTLSALFSAFFAGLLVLLFGEKSDAKHHAITSSCCGTEKQNVIEDSCCGSSCDSTPLATETKSNFCETETPIVTTNSCCNSEKQEADSCCGAESTDVSESEKPFWKKAWDGIHYAFTSMLSDIIFWLLIGLGFAAVVQTYLPPDFLTQWGSGLLAMMVMLLIGIPMYVCATASTPIAVGLIMAGISPGVALVFLLSGPATNIGTLGIITKMLGQRTMWLYLIGTVTSALAAGLLLDAVLSQTNWDLVANMHAHHDTIPMWIQASCLVILTWATLAIYWKKWQKTA